MLTGEISENSSGTLYTRIVAIFLFITVKTYLSYNECVAFEFILTLSYYFCIQFWSFLLIRAIFKLEPRHLLTIFVLLILYVKASRMIRTVIRTGNHTHTCSYLLGMYIFMFISRENCT